MNEDEDGGISWGKKADLRSTYGKVGMEEVMKMKGFRFGGADIRYLPRRPLNPDNEKAFRIRNCSDGLAIVEMAFVLGDERPPNPGSSGSKGAFELRAR